jgi:hypothetical protein
VETQLLPYEAVYQFGLSAARALLLSEEGKRLEYWRKPLLGKPFVAGGAYVVASYYHFVVGCSLAGLVKDVPSMFAMKAIPEAESLVTYFLEVPEVKSVLDQHFKDSDEYAAKTLSPEMRDLIGDTRSMFVQSGRGRGDEALMSVLWAVLGKSRFTIDESIQAYANFVLQGAVVEESEVKRLWGIQASATPVPLLGMPFAQAQASTVHDLCELVPPLPGYESGAGADSR